LIGHNVDVALGNTVRLSRGFDPEQLLQDIEAFGVTQLIGSPAMYYALLRSPHAGSRNLSSVRLAISGAAPIDTTGCPLIARPMGRVIDYHGQPRAARR
jgi:long-chain acyl-CoA synthetase